MLDNIEHLPLPTTATLPPGKTVEFIVSDASTADIDSVDQPAYRHSYSKAPITVENSSACIDVEQSTTDDIRNFSAT